MEPRTASPCTITDFNSTKAAKQLYDTLSNQLNSEIYEAQRISTEHLSHQINDRASKVSKLSRLVKQAGAFYRQLQTMK